MNMAAIRILRPGDEATLEAFLLPRAESSMFLISNMRSSGLVDFGQPYEGTYAAAFEGGNIVAVVALGEKDSPQLRERCRASIERSLREGYTWILEDQGQPVACSSFNAATKEAVQVGGVWTPPEFRRRGYGRAVVAASLLDARAENVERAILFTGKTNVAAQKAYVALGFRHIGDYRIVLLESPLERASQE